MLFRSCGHLPAYQIVSTLPSSPAACVLSCARGHLRADETSSAIDPSMRHRNAHSAPTSTHTRTHSSRFTTACVSRRPAPKAFGVALRLNYIGLKSSARYYATPVTLGKRFIALYAHEQGHASTSSQSGSARKFESVCSSFWRRRATPPPIGEFLRIEFASPRDALAKGGGSDPIFIRQFPYP